MKGQIPPETLDALLEALPVEWSVVDKNDRVLGWNKHDTRIFKRPESAYGRDVRNCHPKNSLYKVEQILEEMKKGKRDKAEFWINLNIGDKLEKVYIQYRALRDKDGNYLGCLECSQKISYLHSLQGEKRLLD